MNRRKLIFSFIIINFIAFSTCPMPDDIHRFLDTTWRSAVLSGIFIGLYSVPTICAHVVIYGMKNVDRNKILQHSIPLGIVALSFRYYEELDEADIWSNIQSEKALKAGLLAGILVTMIISVKLNNWIARNYG